MRIWSFHPMYLDNIGLSRAINEAIGGYKALTGQQKMWANHSQLKRFSTYTGKDSLQNYITFLIELWNERKYKAIDGDYGDIFIPKGYLLEVTTGQLKYEWQHYLNKLKTQKGRDKQLYEKLKNIELPEAHPLFKVIDGEVEEWEKVKS